MAQEHTRFNLDLSGAKQASSLFHWNLSWWLSTVCREHLARAPSQGQTSWMLSTYCTQLPLWGGGPHCVDSARCRIEACRDADRDHPSSQARWGSCWLGLSVPTRRNLCLAVLSGVSPGGEWLCSSPECLMWLLFWGRHTCVLSNHRTRLADALKRDLLFPLLPNLLSSRVKSEGSPLFWFGTKQLNFWYLKNFQRLFLVSCHFWKQSKILWFKIATCDEGVAVRWLLRHPELADGTQCHVSLVRGMAGFYSVLDFLTSAAHFSLVHTALSCEQVCKYCDISFNHSHSQCYWRWSWCAG